MTELHFDWDPRKNASNKRKHGVSFPEAESVFSDERALLVDDTEHSDKEDRFVLLGLSSSLRTLVVCHCYRDPDDTIRIISARKANKLERAAYSKRWET